MIERDAYMNRLIRSMWNGEIKVITGIRRCGKSVLLFDLFYEYLLSQGVPEDHILKIELDQRRYYRFRNPITLCEYVENTVRDRKDEKFYLLIDEVRLTAKMVDRENGGIEVTVYDMLNELKAYKNLDVYVTGSNSKGLSKDIATEFRGRATQIHVFPLSFAEFYAAVGGDERKALDTYMLYGGMPRLLALEDDKDKKDYLTSLYSELYVRDIVERNGIEREDNVICMEVFNLEVVCCLWTFKQFMLNLFDNNILAIEHDENITGFEVNRACPTLDGRIERMHRCTSTHSSWQLCFLPGASDNRRHPW